MALISCHECGKEISDKSKCCINCGYKLKKNYKQYIKTFFNKIKYTINTIINKINSISKKKRIITSIILLLIIIIVSYIAIFNKCYEDAKEYYEDEEYSLAYSRIKFLFLNISGEEDFYIIKESGKYEYYMYYQMAELYLSGYSTDYEKSCEYLLKGLYNTEHFYSNLENPTSIQTKVYKNFKDLYMTKLNIYLDMSDTEILEAIKDFSSIENTAKTYANKIERKQYYDKNPVEFKNVSLSTNSLYNIATGTVYNRSSKTIKFVEVKASFKDRSGKVIDTDWTYAVGSEGLAPGESSTFRCSITKNINVNSVSMSLIEFD